MAGDSCKEKEDGKNSGTDSLRNPAGNSCCHNGCRVRTRHAAVSDKTRPVKVLVDNHIQNCF